MDIPPSPKAGNKRRERSNRSSPAGSDHALYKGPGTDQAGFTAGLPSDQKTLYNQLYGLDNQGNLENTGKNPKQGTPTQKRIRREEQAREIQREIQQRNLHLPEGFFDPLTPNRIT